MSMFLTPIGGAVGGGAAVKTSGAVSTVSGIAIGFGVGILALVLFVFRKVANIPSLEKFKRLGFALFAVFLVPMP